MAKKKKAAKKTETANTNLRRQMTAKEIKEAHGIVDDVLSLEKEGVVIAITQEKYSEGGKRGTRQKGIVFAEGMDKAKVIAAVAQGMGATTLDLLLAMAEAKKGDDQEHEHDEDGNCLR